MFKITYKKDVQSIIEKLNSLYNEVDLDSRKIIQSAQSLLSESIHGAEFLPPLFVNAVHKLQRIIDKPMSFKDHGELAVEAANLLGNIYVLYPEFLRKIPYTIRKPDSTATEPDIKIYPSGSVEVKPGFLSEAQPSEHTPDLNKPREAVQPIGDIVDSLLKAKNELTKHDLKLEFRLTSL